MSLKLAPPQAAGPRSDDELLTAFLSGDTAAFDALVRLYETPLYRLCRRYTRRPDDARDLCQRAFLRAFAAAQRTRLAWRKAEPFPFRAWLFRIAINLAKNAARDSARWNVVGLDDAPTSASNEVSAHQALEHDEAARRVRTAVLALPRREREVFTLRIDADLPFADVARTLGITENNAKVTFHHACKHLKAAMGAEEKP